MSAAALPLSPDQTALAELVQLVCECTALDARFRLCGYTVDMDGLELLPEPLQDRLIHYLAPGGWMWAFLGGERRDAPALALSEALGVRPVLAESRLDARAAVRTLITDMRNHNGTLGLDIETSNTPPQWVRINQDGVVAERQKTDQRDRTALDPHRSSIATMQIYAGGAECFLFRSTALALVLHANWLRRQIIIVHNAGMECRFLLHHANHPQPAWRRGKRGQLHCTMQAMGLLHGVGYHGEGRSLENAVKTRLGITVPKDLQRSDWSAPILSPGQLAYGCSDAILAYKLGPGMFEELTATGRKRAYELQRGAVPAVADMELRGLGFNRDEHARQTRLWDEQLAQARQAFEDVEKAPPPAKPDDVIAWLARKLSPQDRESWWKTPTGKLSTAAGHLKRLLSLEVPGAHEILVIKKLEQLITNFGPNLLRHISPATGRLHASYNIAGAKSGRFSANAPNPQNLPGKRAPEFKRCVIARPGYVLICADYDQVEFRAAGRIAKEPALDRLYEDGRDLHRETAARILGIALDDVTKEQRGDAKCIGFGGIYGMGGASLREYAFTQFDVDMTERQAKEALYSFFRPLPKLDRWRGDHADLCQRRGYIVIGAGRVVMAEWEPYGLSFQQCCNLPVQGACADVMLRALRLVHMRLLAARVRGGLVASVHDEIVLEVHEDDAELAKQILEESMVEAFTATFPGAAVNGLVKVNIGLNWGEAK